MNSNEQATPLDGVSTGVNGSHAVNNNGSGNNSDNNEFNTNMAQISTPAVLSAEPSYTDRKKKRTAAENKQLTERIKEALLAGHPLQVIAIAQGVSLDAVNKIFAKLMMTDFRNMFQASSYEVEASGIPVSKLPLLELNGAKFIRIEHYENGIYIQPFTLENNNV